MQSNKIDLSIVIEFIDNNFAEVVLKSLEPENSQIDKNSSIQMRIDTNKLIIEYFSTSPLSTIRSTIDDIFSTINTSETIYKTVKRVDKL